MMLYKNKKVMFALLVNEIIFLTFIIKSLKQMH